MNTTDTNQAPAPALQPGPGDNYGILPSLHAVMAEIKAVGKDGTNKHNGYNFRGIDGVLNAVGPVLRQYAVLLVPTVEEINFGEVHARGGAVMTTVRLRMRVTLYDMDGSNISATVWGEAFDSGDKATAKAHSVALRTALIQMLALPTQEPDPDEATYERRDAGQTMDQKLADANQCTRQELLAMLQAAQRAGNRPLYDRIMEIGQRRFPKDSGDDQAPAPEPADPTLDQDEHN